MSHTFSSRGFSLIELLIAVGLGTVLLAGLMSVVQAAATSFRLQQELSLVQESARFAAQTVSSIVQGTGFRPEPWSSSWDLGPVTHGSSDSFNGISDRLVLRRWSNHNCFHNANSVLDLQGQPQHYLMETSVSALPGGTLALTCRYGPGPGQLVTQVNNLGLVEHVEGFQLQFAEDTDSDGSADRWVRAGQWEDESRLLGVRFALLLASPGPLSPHSTQTIQLLDHVLEAPADGRLRRVFQTAAAFEGQRQ